MEADPELVERLEDLAFAFGCNVGQAISRIVTENLKRYEEETWALKD